MPDLNKEKLKFTLDLSKLDLERVYVSRNGGRFLEFECIPSPGKYDQTHFLTQRQTKDEREAKVRLPILGNLALAFPPKAGTTHSSATQGAHRMPPPARPSTPPPDDDIAF